jgi:hypothetical protein
VPGSSFLFAVGTAHDADGAYHATKTITCIQGALATTRESSIIMEHMMHSDRSEGRRSAHKGVGGWVALLSAVRPSSNVCSPSLRGFAASLGLQFVRLQRTEPIAVQGVERADKSILEYYYY